LAETQELVPELVKEQVSVVEESGPTLVTPLVTETRVDTGPQPIKPIKGNECLINIFTIAQRADLDLSRKVLVVVFFMP